MALNESPSQAEDAEEAKLHIRPVGKSLPQQNPRPLNTHIHIGTHPHNHTHTRTHTDTYTHTHTHSHPHSHTPTHTLTFLLLYVMGKKVNSNPIFAQHYHTNTII